MNLRIIFAFYTGRAIQRGRYPQRVVRKAAYRSAGRVIRRSA
jgi:hypothetical protein